MNIQWYYSAERVLVHRCWTAEIPVNWRPGTDLGQCQYSRALLLRTLTLTFNSSIPEDLFYRDPWGRYYSPIQVFLLLEQSRQHPHTSGSPFVSPSTHRAIRRAFANREADKYADQAFANTGWLSLQYNSEASSSSSSAQPSNQDQARDSYTRASRSHLGRAYRKKRAHYRRRNESGSWPWKRWSQQQAQEQVQQSRFRNESRYWQDSTLSVDFSTLEAALWDAATWHAAALWDDFQ